MDEAQSVILVEGIANRIYLIRGKKVMLVKTHPSLPI
jgi:hypothetical protein